jgi:hydroxymethylpyrimidine/phosphomethylpyrimidine kinase
LKIDRALTIAGSDSGGGAGIQADLKTFAALGVYGMCVITAVTAQNTMAVTAIQDIDQEVVKAQIEAVVEDIGVDASKTGMLHTREIINVVAKSLRRYGFPVVVDPVMVAKSGARLLKQEAVEVLVESILPLATVVTPNVPEAVALSGLEVNNVEDAKKAAKRIVEFGPKAVVVKGGHIPSKGKVVDVLYDGERFHVFETDELITKTTHGTGCTFSSAIAAYLAKGEAITEAVKLAKEFVYEAIRFGIPIGQAHGPVNPLASLYKKVDKYYTLENINVAIRILEDSRSVFKLIPEVNSNLVMAPSYAVDYRDVAGIPGRIAAVGTKVKAISCPAFGASRHVANTVLVAKSHNPEIRAAMNIRYGKHILRKIEELGLLTSAYDRRKEPQEVKMVEGMTTRWGAEEAIKSAGRVPDAIYHDGDWGKEAMITILGRDALDVVNKVIKIAESLT